MADRAEVAAARALLQDAIGRRVFPSAVAEVGSSHAVLWREAFGRLTFDPRAPLTTIDTIFDLASLTKPIATTTVILDLIAHGRLALDQPVGHFLREWRGADRESATIRDLLEHASGLPARLVDRPPTGRREFEHEICTMPLEYAPRERSVYSDLGFILLAFIAADLGASLSRQFEGVLDRLGIGPRQLGASEMLVFNPQTPADRVAPTRPLDEDARRGRLLTGEVQDDYAAALGGAAGHAGLFGSSSSVGAFAQLALRAAAGDRTVPEPLTPELVTLAVRRSAVADSSRALGWDTMLPTSSCGTHLSAAAFGHVGFTGTSLWIDPAIDRYFVLLTNRSCDGGTLEEMRVVRRGFHDALRIVVSR